VSFAVIGLLVQIAALATARADEVEFFVLWGINSRWDGTLEVRSGRLLQVEPYSFEAGDEWQGADERRAQWRSGTGFGVDGIHVRAEATPDTVFGLRTPVCTRDLRWADFQDGDQQVPVRGEDRFLILGRGSPQRGPQLPRSIPLPDLFTAPRPTDPTPVPGDHWTKDEPVVVRLDREPAGPVSARRVSQNDGRLYVEIHSPTGGLSRWLSLPPRIGTLDIRVTWPGGETTVTVATTLVEVRGPRLYVNGEPFLVKGTLPRNLNDADAEYLRSLCANTVRARSTDYLDKYGFMGIIMTGRGPAQFCKKAATDAQFRKGLAQYLKGHDERCRPVASNPRTLIIQHGNEQVTGDGWAGQIPLRTFDRLDYLLARCCNIARPMDPMLPQGYSNCAFGYRAPGFLDVYLHNTYLSKDRNWPPLEEFMEFQGCDERPYVNTEFGANVYMPQAYLGGPNTPVLEKIHAWNYPNRWNTYLAAGTSGGTNYCFYDYDYSKVNVNAWDKGFTNFGVMTFDRQPKLACWGLWHLWRDFEVTADGRRGLRITYCRDYWARDCRLTIRSDGEEQARDLDDFAPNSQRTVAWDELSAPFRWRLDYTTHAGLTMVACGAYPRSAEAEDFLQRLQGRETFAFLRELFDAEVLAADGRRVGTLREMEREDGVVPVVFRKPNGVAYVTAFTRRAEGLYAEPVEIDVAFAGRVEAVDEMTGGPTGARVEVGPLADGLRLRNLRVPKIPTSYTQRAKTPIELPVYRITPR
jgi:hypothetical protein